MLKKTLAILIILVGLGVGGFLVYRKYFAPKEFYKGVWMPGLGAHLIPEDYLPKDLLPEGYNMSVFKPVFADFNKAKEAGINTFAFQIGYFADENGELSLVPGEKEFLANFIDEAHAKGFKIWLNPEILHRIDRGGSSEMRKIPEEWIENTDLIENFKDAIVETAKFAQEHDVEMFSPSSEMYVNIGRERSKEVIVDIKPQIDAVYSGKICLRAEAPNPPFVPAYSCFGLPVNMPRNEEEKTKLVNRMEQEEAKNVELMVGELWEGNDWYGSQEEALKGFKAALEAVKGKVNGIFILDTGRTYRQLFPESFETTLTQFYQEF